MLTFGIEEAGSRRLHLKARALCPHCRKVVIGKAHVPACAKLAAKSEAGCIDCGDPVKGRCKRCEPCRRIANVEYQERYASSPKGRATIRARYVRERAKNKQRHKAWRNTPRGRELVRRARERHYLKHRARVIEGQRRWCLRNKAHVAAYARDYYRKHKDKWNAYRRARRARIRAATPTR